MTLVRAATLDDVKSLVPRLRKEDVDECVAALGFTPEAPLASALHEGYAYAGLADGQVEILFGATPSDRPDVGVVWLVGSDALVTRHAWKFLRNSKAALALVHQHYPILWNFTDARNTVHHRWLQWLGFQIVARHEKFGAAQIPFYEFIRCAHP